MSASSGAVPSPNSFFARTTALTYIVVAVVSFAAVFGSLAALGGFAGGGTSTSGEHTVTFVETGLPQGANFSIAFAGATKWVDVAGSGAAEVQFSELPGLYLFVVGIVTGYASLPSSGEIRVNTTNLVMPISFSTLKPPIGTAFAAGNPLLGLCSSGFTYASDGCHASDYTYLLTIEYSTVTFGSLLFEVETSSGAVYHLPSGAGGFSITDVHGNVAAQTAPVPASGPLAMTTTWTTYGGSFNSTSPLSTIFSIVLDMGTTNPTGTGLTFVVSGTGGFSGSTSPLPLP